MWATSGAVNDRNGRLPGASPYSRLTPVAKNVLSYGAEFGFNFGNVFNIAGCPKFMPFGRYEYCNPQKVVEKPYVADKRPEVSKWVVGLDWFIVAQPYCQSRLFNEADRHIQGVWKRHLQ